MIIKPVHIKKYGIYDIYHNDNDQIIIILPFENKPINIKYIDSNNIIDFTIQKCPYKHTYIYILNDKVKYKKNIILDINGNRIITKANKYPKFKNKIIMSTIVKDEDLYIKQWINFHLNIGIDKFIIYDNSRKNKLQKTLSDYIKNKLVVLIKWNYPYRLPKSGISGQTTQQNHSIYAFQHSKYIGLFDIDEYVNMQDETNIKKFFTKLIINKKININSIGSFRILNKFFFNPHNLPTKGYDFLKIYHCKKITKREHEKNFVIPKNVSTFSVHMITKGKKIYKVNSKKMYFNHYFFLNKKDRGRDNTKFIDTSITKHTKNLL